MATLLLKRGENIQLKNDISPFIFIRFILCGKTDIKYEISLSELTPPLNFSLMPPKIEKLTKSWTMTPETKNDVITGDQ